MPCTLLVSTACVSLFPARLTLLCKPQLVHAPLDGRPRLQERSFQIGLMVLLSVVVRHRPRSIPWAQLADVAQTAVDQHEHVLRRLVVEEPPIAAAGHIDRPGGCHHPAPPDILLLDWPRATGA